MIQIFLHRKFSGLMFTAVPLVLLVAGITTLVRARTATPLLGQLIAWPILLMMAWGLIVGLRMLWNPPLIYRADRRGVMIYWDAEKFNFVSDGVFLPWSLVKNMSLVKRNCVGNMGNRAYTWIIACTLEDDAPFPIEKHSVAYMSQDGKRVVCLDAFVGTLSRQAMLDQLLSFLSEANKLKHSADGQSL